MSTRTALCTGIRQGGPSGDQRGGRQGGSSGDQRGAGRVDPAGTRGGAGGVDPVGTRGGQAGWIQRGPERGPGRVPVGTRGGPGRVEPVGTRRCGSRDTRGVSGVVNSAGNRQGGKPDRGPGWVLRGRTRQGTPSEGGTRFVDPGHQWKEVRQIQGSQRGRLGQCLKAHSGTRQDRKRASGRNRVCLCVCVCVCLCVCWGQRTGSVSDLKVESLWSFLGSSGAAIAFDHQLPAFSGA